MTFSERLGYAGLLPFIAATMAIPTKIEGAVSFFILYSALILSFMAGGCWGVLQANYKQVKNVDLAISIGVFLWGWLMYFLPESYAVPGLLLGFLSLFTLEQRQLYASVYSASYRKLRSVLTVVVGICHVLIIWWLAK